MGAKIFLDRPGRNCSHLQQLANFDLQTIIFGASDETSATRNVKPIDTFTDVVNGNLDSLLTLTEELVDHKHVTKGHYDGTVDVQYRDALREKGQRRFAL